MPLRDHFHPPLSDRRAWEGFHNLWPGQIVRHLLPHLPEHYYAAPARPTRDIAVEFPEQNLVEILVYDEQHGSRLVAAVELVSPRNKDRPAARQAFAVKCASYLQQKISLVVVDPVTDRHDNLHAELLRLLSIDNAGVGHALHATAYRTNKHEDRWQLEIWHEPLAVGAALPTLPLWLTGSFAVPLELEASYEETCQLLRIV